ncbi:uncharacterized protein CTHT_0049470 [Thermochaetoides thermophila DSM 1495]|uniref:Metallo-beta-lactamase domain-containing protein n=1 Tax=Chaetomium thermophilum (strain DSM 1495 / CBS 144.50 / IMI 039719) TaxID=759272 RepID=G0SBA0_CHATD|nr:hypothetical protein CTHT_0049470 [Thermochaetoides thermophila DSM 1495]EGS19480.1 hypothetical protein CTHT_0049470 [Thermochaetoides thermophila DSM 1495]
MNPCRLPLTVRAVEPACRALLTPLAGTSSSTVTVTSAARLPSQDLAVGSQRRTIHQHARPMSAAAARQLPKQPVVLPGRTLIQKRAHSSRAMIHTPPPAPEQPLIHSLFEPVTSTFQYVVADPATNKAVIIDPVLDYDNVARTIKTHSADNILELIKKNGYEIVKILETHAHADHLTSAFYLQKKLEKMQGYKPGVGIGKRIGQVQRVFGERYGVSTDEYDGVFDTLFDDDEVFEIGSLRASAIHLPGHTPDHMGYRVGDSSGLADNIFCGDSLFHPQTLGTARCDFPGGSAEQLYYSGRMLLSLPDHVRIWVGHDYAEDGRQPEPWATVAEHRLYNRHLRDGITEKEFVQMRKERDRQLAAPRLLHESLQVNIRGGHLPKVNAAGMRTFAVPVQVQGEAASVL